MNGMRPSSMNVLKIVDVPSTSRLQSHSQPPSLSPAQSPQDADNFRQDFSPRIITLNVGGTIYTTSLETLLKCPNSMLSAMFSGRHRLAVDDRGRYFIDREGKLFVHILNFLRQKLMPPLENALDVYEEALFYNIEPLIEALSLTCPVAGYKMRRLFLDKVPNYDRNIEALIEKAQECVKETLDRISKLRVCIFKEDSPLSPYENSILPQVPADKNPNPNCRKRHRCDVSLSFGPWNAAADIYDLIHCIKMDLSERGYNLECQCIGVCDQKLNGYYYCKRPIYEFKIYWW